MLRNNYHHRLYITTLLLATVTVVHPYMISHHQRFSSSSLSSTHHRVNTQTTTATATVTLLSASYDSNIEDEFASFAATLDDDNNNNNNNKNNYNSNYKTQPSTSTSTASSAQSIRNDSNSKWKDDLDKLIFDRTTTRAQRQILISDLIRANNDIRQSVTTALRERTIDPLLTPTGKKFQDGTRAVAYQLQTDILPSLTAAATASASGNSASNGSSSSSSNSNSLFPPPPVPLPDLSSLFPPIPNPEDITKFSNRLLSTVTNQIQKNVEILQSDLQTDPMRRIPERIAKQAEDILNEASNVFAETPIGLQEPPYTVVMRDNSNNYEYEIRDYPEYTVATTTMITAINEDLDNTVDLSSTIPSTMTTTITSAVTDQGVAFNTLASYIFGSNSENRVMEMTTPVTTTMSGEMRFYIPTSNPPQPLTQDAVSSASSTTDKELLAYDTTPSKIRIETIPAARLAVRRFTGFCTAGEIQRQKDTLLSAIQQNPMIEIDVPHGQPVKHILFQYNPPYTLPVIRRNEIAVPVSIVSVENE